MKPKIFLFFIVFFILGLPWKNIYAKDAPYIRVAVLQNAAEAYLTISGSFDVYDSKTQMLIYRVKGLNNVRLYAASDGLLLGNINLGSPRIKIVPKKDASIYINKRRFRGELEVIKNENSTFLVVNHLDLEDYIRGVLYHEISHFWPMEAIKAQAVAARTFAYYQATVNKDKDFDLTSDIYSQVYGGRTSEKFRTNIAVDRTRGQVLVFDDKVFPAYYHATCAGHTEDASRLWNIKLKPLEGVVCKFCQGSPHLKWNTRITLKAIEDKLNTNNFKIRGVTDIDIIKRNDSGRIDLLKIQAADGALSISGKDFRQALGPNIIRSLNFVITVIGQQAEFLGLGWGHGVGLCQWGAYFMAKSRYKYDAILKFYYPQSRIKRIE